MVNECNQLPLGYACAIQGVCIVRVLRAANTSSSPLINAIFPFLLILHKRDTTLP